MNEKRSRRGKVVLFISLSEFGLVLRPCFDIHQLLIDTSNILAMNTIWLYCVECPQYSTRLEALAYLYDNRHGPKSGGC